MFEPAQKCAKNAILKKNYTLQLLIVFQMRIFKKLNSYRTELFLAIVK